MTFETTNHEPLQSESFMMTHTGHHELACANCGTPLSAMPREESIQCLFCGQRHKFLEPPETDQTTDFHVGDAVAVEWEGHWWSAHVVEAIEPGNSWHVHFEGWAPAFDDVVGPDRIRAIDYVPGDSIVPPAPVTAKLEVKRSSMFPAIGVILALIAGIGFTIVWATGEQPHKYTDNIEAIAEDNISAAGAIMGPISNQRVTPMTPVHVGQKFQVKWGDNWYLGTAMHVDDIGEIIIRYDGWGDQYDEVVSRDRLRLIE